MDYDADELWQDIQSNFEEGNFRGLYENASDGFELLSEDVSDADISGRTKELLSDPKVFYPAMGATFAGAIGLHIYKTPESLADISLFQDDIPHIGAFLSLAGTSQKLSEDLSEYPGSKYLRYAPVALLVGGAIKEGYDVIDMGVHKAPDSFQDAVANGIGAYYENFASGVSRYLSKVGEVL